MMARYEPGSFPAGNALRSVGNAQHSVGAAPGTAADTLGPVCSVALRTILTAAFWVVALYGVTSASLAAAQSVSAQSEPCRSRRTRDR